MEIKKGSSRVVLIIGNYVLKFPVIKITTLVHFWITAIFKYSYSLGSIYRQTQQYYFITERGIKQNLSEGRIWNATHSSILAPVLFSSRLLNIAKFVEGETISENDVWKNCFLILPEDLMRCVYCIDPHCIDGSNFRKTQLGYILVDYGETSEDQIFEMFIKEYYKSLEGYWQS